MQKYQEEFNRQGRKKRKGNQNFAYLAVEKAKATGAWFEQVRIATLFSSHLTKICN
jgi:hypothetical protein